jgi:hypothetical protein
MKKMIQIRCHYFGLKDGRGNAHYDLIFIQAKKSPLFKGASIQLKLHMNTL